MLRWASLESPCPATQIQYDQMRSAAILLQTCYTQARRCRRRDVQESLLLLNTGPDETVATWQYCVIRNQDVETGSCTVPPHQVLTRGSTLLVSPSMLVRSIDTDRHSSTCVKTSGIFFTEDCLTDGAKCDQSQQYTILVHTEQRGLA